MHLEKTSFGFSHIYVGATGFDIIAMREAASRGLLATLNRGIVKLIDNNRFELAAA